MSEFFYRSVRLAGGLIFRFASRPVILHRERAHRPGAYLLAANHESPFDAPLLILATPRVIYWLSIVELFRRPFSRWFLTAMLTAPLDRGKVDTATIRTMTRHLRAGRVVGLFPEGGVRTGVDSVLENGALSDGVARLAQLAGVPVLPCVVLGGRQFEKWTSWLPLFRTRWAIAYGEPIFLPGGVERPAALAQMTAQIERALRAMHAELVPHV